ncbi:metal ABC transporter ATP-binding protein [Haloglycomyces albus]|uniref:metal ABC transporter ATP-binding protein n=1 Tax=Haloglycomyces albus TaxID=526067 RepID=UPI00046D784C|nr:ATP-binding cassette domain-containing protein [Haloglycomyces albus]
MASHTPTAVTISDAVVSYHRQPVLSDFNLDIHPGESVALTGSNGSGKSTLIKAVLGLTPLSAGRIELFGRRRLNRRVRARIGYVPQRADGQGNIPTTVYETVASGRLNRRPTGFPATRDDRVATWEAIAAVDLNVLARKPMGELSGGQQQRAYIARALAGAPDMLIMDEPTVGVDVETQELLTEVIARKLDEGCTLVLVTHEAGPLQQYLHRTVHLHRGRKAYDGPSESKPGPSGDSQGCLHPDQLGDTDTTGLRGLNDLRPNDSGGVRR